MKAARWRGGGGGGGGAALVRCALLLLGARAQEPDVLLPQGRVVGIKVYPESSATPVEIYLGIPYAAPPIGRLRFSAPARHTGWNRTLFAHKPAPRCPQPPPTTAQTSRLPRESEDCLYLNVWAPERGSRGRGGSGGGGGGGGRPVLVLLHSESWSRGTGAELAGQDVAAEGVLLVQPAYRLNALGLLALGSAAARGNLALLDQYFALLWVRENIARFGGDPDHVTLLGHSAGAVGVLYHLVSPRTQGLFQRAIIMSPTELWRVLAERSAAEEASEARRAARSLAARLGCDAAAAAADHDVVRCLQTKSTDELMAAYATQYPIGKWNGGGGGGSGGGGGGEGGMRPVCDAYLPAHAQYVPRPLAHALLDTDRLATPVPLLFGITDLDAIDSNEEWWRELAARGATRVIDYATHSAVPELLRLHDLDNPHTLSLLTEAVVWEYWGASGAEGGGWRAAEALARAESAARCGAGAALLAARLARLSRPAPLYVYRYTQPGGVDLRGNELNHTGAAHGAELAPALGAAMLQELVRRRATADELRLVRQMRFLLHFTKSPMASGARDGWPPYRPGAAHVQRISLRGGGGGDGNAASDDDATFWLRYLPRLLNASAATPDPAQYTQPPTAEAGTRLRGAVYALASVAGALAALLAVSAVLLRRAARARDAA